MKKKAKQLNNLISLHDDEYKVLSVQLNNIRIEYKNSSNLIEKIRSDIDKYNDETLSLMRQAGCRMIFFGAESGNDEILKQMDKGGIPYETAHAANSAAIANFPNSAFDAVRPGLAAQEGR